VSKGAGSIERRIADLLNKSDRVLSIDDITDHAFKLRGRKATRAQRLSATRAAHRLLRRAKEAEARADELSEQMAAAAIAALGPESDAGFSHPHWEHRWHDPRWPQLRALRDFARHIDMWRTTTKDRRLYFHPIDVPMEVWAVTIDRSGIHWFDAEIIRVTDRNVMVRYAGVTARLDRMNLWQWWAFWRGVCFVSSRTGRIAKELDDIWHQRYGHATGGPPPAMQMPLEQARLLLGLPANYSKADVLAAFRSKAKQAHPDVGGTPEIFRLLVEARDRLLTALGTREAPPKPPSYAPRGADITYRTYRSGSSRARLGTGSSQRLT
jgi:hypothetical protein